MSRKNKKRTYKNVTTIYIIISSNKSNTKATPTQKIAFVTALITLISTVISLVIKLM